MDASEGFKASVEEVTADGVEIARELESKWSLKMTLNCYNLVIKLEQTGSLLLLDEQRKWFLEMKSPGGDAGEIVEMQKQRI